MLTPSAEALAAVLVELERHVGAAGWDQPARLFALVATDELIEAEPALAASLRLRSSAGSGVPDALTAVEQDQFTPTYDLLTDLSGIGWAAAVVGCAVAVERSMLSATAEADLPDDPDAAAAFVSNHPDRFDLRLVVGADRAGHAHGLGRLRSRPEDLLSAPDLVPDLATALASTLAVDVDDPDRQGELRSE